MEIEEFVNANKDKLKILAGFALVFVLGFASGYYYLDGNKSPDVLTVKDNSDSCAALFKQNPTPDSTVAAAAPEQKDNASKTAENPTGSVLASNVSPQTSDSSPVVKAFASSKNSTLYHTPNCPYVKRIKPENLVWFGSQKEAEAAGRKPHSCVKK
jgi:hypothetical protein